MEKIVLNKTQQQAIKKCWNDAVKKKEPPPALIILVRAAFSDKKDVTVNSPEGRAVRAFLFSSKLVKDLTDEELDIYMKGKEPEEKHDDSTNLTPEEKEFCRQNGSTMSPRDIARVLKNDEKLTHKHKISRDIASFLKSLNKEDLYKKEEIPESDYSPPKRPEHAIARVNKYVLNGIDKSKISLSQKKSVSALIEYMHTFRFLHQITNYETRTERQLFESSFVRYTWDKPDLTQEEVDQYIVLSSEVVIASNIQNRINTLQEHLDESANDSEGRKISMSLVESISTCQSEYNQCVNRQQKLLNDLKEKRSARLSKQVKENASILNLVQMWKDEESRKKMIHLADLRKKVLKDEVNRLSGMDEIRARIMGLSEEEALDG